jgi:hypothetical protein
VSVPASPFDVVVADIRAVVEAAAGNLVKVILETCYLTDEEKRGACLLAMEAEAAFVKTSTGFASGGATVEDVLKEKLFYIFIIQIAILSERWPPYMPLLNSAHSQCVIFIEYINNRRIRCTHTREAI